MKEAKGIFLALFLFTMVGVHAQEAQEITVRSERHPDVNFSKYKTYYWATQVDQQLDDDYYFLNDLVLKADVRDAVRGELEGRGYRANRTKPDLIVNFRVFDRAVTLRGYQGYGATYWGANEYNPSVDDRSVEVEAGTLIISLLDRESGELVWQGFSSGLIDGKAFIKDEGKIREAVNLIFEEHGIRVSEYTKR